MARPQIDRVEGGDCYRVVNISSLSPVRDCFEDGIQVVCSIVTRFCAVERRDGALNNQSNLTKEELP